MEFLSQKPLYSNDPGTKGFDLSSGKIWIYPENYPLREYQFQIVQSALYHNTLVCLPTGLGKTFVAAVVMYNFWRWYPQGKIVFLAPTKPLVAQQINACQEIMGIPATETIELTGTTDQKKRKVAWLKHRVIFATPQTFQKDLEKNIVPSDRVKCVVIDEAHKALGKHSYCEGIRLLSEQNEYYRILALSATPGGKLDAVQEVVRNLHITHMELRDDTSPDIIPYINERKLDIVLVDLGEELKGFKERYIIIMDRHVRLLIENNVLRGFAGNISKGRIFHLHKEWQQKSNTHGNYGQIMKTLTILMTMYHAYELMIRHGLRAFYNFYQNHMDKYWLHDEKDLLSLLEEINYYLGPFPEIRPMPDGTVPEVPEDIRFGHNKFQKLKEILLRHFESFETKKEDTRAIVFVEYRDIVNEVYVLLLQSRPLIRPQKFVGQAGLKQKQQKLALENFRSNKVNVLISTSVGEEGLDVGEVDLIVCFDISQHSPIRLVQRMGRTGRKRDGHIVVLVTDGKEHQTLKSTMSRRDSLNTKVLHSSGIISALHENSPRMVPAEFNPECRKMVMMVIPKAPPIKRKGKTKETKKPTTRKTKNSKIPEPSTSNKPGGSQSSLMSFFKKPTEDPTPEIDNEIVAATINKIPASSFTSNRATQCSQQSLKNNNAIKSSEVKLLTSDDAAVDFLTLCTMKKSENELIFNDKAKTNPFIPAYYSTNQENENFFDFQVPDLQILNCLENITDCVVPTLDNDNKNDVVSLSVSSERFNDCNDFYATSQNEILEEDSKFEALLDESSDDSDVNVVQTKNDGNNDVAMNDFVDWDENIGEMTFEDLLDETSNETKISVHENAVESNEANEIRCRSPIDLLDERGMFEDILDSSSNDSEAHCSPRNINVKFEAIDANASMKNVTETRINDEPKGMFEDILNSSSDDSETDKIFPMEFDVPPANEQIIVTKNVIESSIDNEFQRSNTLNSPSNEDRINCKFEMKSDASEAARKTFATKNFIGHSIHNESHEAIEIILNSSSESNKSVCIVKLNPDLSNGSKKNSSTKNLLESFDNEFKGTFEDIMNSSSDDSETDCSFQAESGVNCAPKKSSTTENPVERSIGHEFEKTNENVANFFADDSETDCSLQLENDVLQPSNATSSTKNTPDIEIDTSIDLLIDRPNPTVFTSSDYDQRNFNVFENSPAPSTSGLSRKNFVLDNSSLLTISQTLREVERMNTRKNVYNASKVNKSDRAMPKDELSTSPVFADRPRASCKSRLGRESPSREIVLSEEDIFCTDDLMVDSDFEAEISSIEKNVRKNLIPDDGQKSSRPIGNNSNEINKNNETKIVKVSPNKIVEYPNSLVVERTEVGIRDVDDFARIRRSTKSSCSSVATSLVSELNLDDWKSDSETRKKIIFRTDVKKKREDSIDFDRGNSQGRVNPATPSAKESLPDTADASDCDWSSVETKRRITPSNKESLSEIVDPIDCDWSEERLKKSTRSFVKESTIESVDLDDFDWTVEEAGKIDFSPVERSVIDPVEFDDDCDWKNDGKNLFSPSVKKSVNAIVIEDCDWSSDFDTTSATLLASTSFRKIDSTIGDDKIVERGEKFDIAAGWRTTKKSKLKLSLGKYLTNNIRKNLSKKENCDKTVREEPDSDSENEFAVGRLEIKQTKLNDSHFFAKPDPVDKITRVESLDMNKSRRIIRQPLSVRRNDVNKLSVDQLNSFAAPNKYTQQQQQQQQRKTTKNPGVGAGRQKSASVDLDAREKKKKRRNERKRVRIRSEFIDDEAEVTSDDDESSGSSGTDGDLEDFVSYTQHNDASVDMHAHYLQTLRSPHRPGLFHARKPRSPDIDLQIYSQPVPDEQNSYLHDSFCVAEDDEVFEDSGTPDEISILEEMERNLRSRKRKRKESAETGGNAKRRLITRPADTSSSEDEFEKLRHQIRDESFVLRN